MTEVGVFMVLYTVLCAVVACGMAFQVGWNRAARYYGGRRGRTLWVTLRHREPTGVHYSQWTIRGDGPMTERKFDEQLADIRRKYQPIEQPTVVSVVDLDRSDAP